MTLSRKSLFFLWCFFVAAAPGFALDREAFSFTNYDLNLQLEPGQRRLGVRGKITLRNDSDTPQKVAILQISSTLGWRSIRAGDKAVQFVSQTYASDIDHTGALSEAIVTLPQAIEPHATVDLEIAYEGIVAPDATRLTRIGTPQEAATSSDWDQINPNFTALRGAGYVAWYPIATEVANLSEDDSLSEVLARWNNREAGSTVRIQISVTTEGHTQLPEILFNGIRCSIAGQMPGITEISAGCAPQVLRLDLPTLVVADYQVLERSRIDVHYLPGHDVAANEIANTAEKVASLIADWFGPQRERANLADLPNPSDAPFESGALLLTPIRSDAAKNGLSAAHQLTHASFVSFRPWIQEGLAHFAQVLYLEQEKGRQAALDYMAGHRSALVEIEPAATPRSGDDVSRSLVNTSSQELYRSKAMCVWWMLRDMIGDAGLKKAFAAYKPEQDKEPSYMPHLIAAQTQRDLEWFFDDWVYRDRGLPDFKVESAFSRKTMTNSYLVTVTLDNLGTSGAEVPILIKTAGGGVMKRLEVRAKNKATVRVETPAVPQEIRVNDGSVPESDTTNNTFKVGVSPS